MAHVTFIRARALPGHRAAVVEQMRRWERERAPRVRGFQFSMLAASNDNPDEIMGAVRFDSTENYMANARDPEQDRWYQELRAHLVEDPTWFDATLVYDSAAAGVR